MTTTIDTVGLAVALEGAHCKPTAYDPPMELSVLPDAYFSCQACSNCCRNWHVELSEAEIARLQSFVWPNDDPLQGIAFQFKRGGRTYLKHADDHACVFLNRNNRLCRIHEQFGEEAKPLGCQLYPFQITPTFVGDATVTGRYDCPAVRRNEGAPYGDSLPQLNRYAKQLNFSQSALNGFDGTDCAGFDRDQIQAICEFAGVLMNGFDQNDQRALFITTLCDWLCLVNTAELNRTVLAEAFPALKKLVETTTTATAKRPGIIHRLAFRTLLGLHLRRDEDVMDGRAGRFGRLIAMLRIVLGGGNFQAMGVLHPPGSLHAAKLFESHIEKPPTATLALHWQMIGSKLGSLQFMGSANAGRDFLTGMRTLALMYPLVIACAKYRAGNRGSVVIDIEDVDYAVATIEHSFGRAPVAVQKIMKSLEAFLLESATFLRLVRTI